MKQEASPTWKKKVREIFNSCQDEFKKTTEIGKKMLSASRVNTELKETYEELGQLTLKAIQNNHLTWNHPQVKDLQEKIAKLEKNLEQCEEDVHRIKAKDLKDQED